MAKEYGYLDELATHYGVFISDLRIYPHLRDAAIRKLENTAVPPHRQQEWQRALEYLTESEVPAV